MLEFENYDKIESSLQEEKGNYGCDDERQPSANERN